MKSFPCSLVLKLSIALIIFPFSFLLWTLNSDALLSSIDPMTMGTVHQRALNTFKVTFATVAAKT